VTCHRLAGLAIVVMICVHPLPIPLPDSSWAPCPFWSFVLRHLHVPFIIPGRPVVQGSVARETNRELLTKPDNDQLDASITGFLFHAAPFALLPGTHQALEWLIRRFAIQHHNVDALLEFALPYHATKLFARVVQLLDFASHTRWQFLTAVKKTGAPLDRATLIKRCAADNGMLAFVCEMPGRALAQEPPPPSVSHLVTFTVSLVLGSIERRVTTNSVTVILPLVLSSLQRDRADCRASALMIIAQLASSTSLAPATSTALFELVRCVRGLHMAVCALLCMCGYAWMCVYG